MEDEPLVPAAPPPSGSARILLVGGLALAGIGALYLMSRGGKRRRKRLTGKAKKAWGRVKGGLALAVLSGFMNRASQKAADRVLR